MAMSVLDRTGDFRQIVMRLSAEGAACSLDRPAPQAQSELSVASAAIGSEIHRASLRVQELRKMARKRGIFDDRTPDIQELTYDIEQNIHTLNQRVAALEARSKGVGPNHNYQKHSASVVETLRTRLMEVTKDFHDALSDRSRALEQQARRRGLYCSGQVVSSGSLTQRRQATELPEDLEGGGGGGMQAMSTHTGYSQGRADAVHQVQRAVGEIAQMLQEYAKVLATQEETVQRIHDDVDDTVRHVTEAQENLLRYFHRISSNRGLIIKVILILTFFAVFFVVFLA